MARLRKLDWNNDSGVINACISLEHVVVSYAFTKITGGPLIVLALVDITRKGGCSVICWGGLAVIKGAEKAGAT